MKRRLRAFTAWLAIAVLLFTFAYSPIVPRAWAACSRVTTWVTDDVLTASALNGEFNNILDNFLACLSPLTTNLDVNSKNLLNVANIDVETAIRDSNSVTLIAPTATGSAVNWLGIANAALSAGPTISTAGTDTDIDLNITPKGAGIIVANQPIKVTDAAGATPTAKVIYEDSIPKAWLAWSYSGGTPTIDDDLNISSITDTATGRLAPQFATAFSTANYGIGLAAGDGDAANPTRAVQVESAATGSMAIIIQNVDSLTNPTEVDGTGKMIAVGNN